MAGERGPVVRSRVARITCDESRARSDDSMQDLEDYEDIVTGECLRGGPGGGDLLPMRRLSPPENFACMPVAEAAETLYGPLAAEGSRVEGMYLDISQAMTQLVVSVDREVE